MSKQCYGIFFGILLTIAGVFGQDTSAQPVRDLYVAVGSEVNIPCFGGEELEWRVNRSALTTGPVLHLRNVSLEDTGVYTCHGLNGDISDQISLHPGYAPSPPVVHCWAPSYPQKAFCSWVQKPDTLLPTQYLKTYPCISVMGSDSLCEMSKLQLFTLQPHILNITAINALGTATGFMQFILEDIVKPDPPVNLTITASSAKRATVEWTPPPSWPDTVHFPLKYTVRYYWDQQQTDHTLGPYELPRITITGLRSGRTYKIQVSAEDLLDQGSRSEWSDPVSLAVPSS
uniref:Fibronectin type-III domain-containing protein n=1 Tax=Denticeps clupeoides TaxID=299321 RepID=A0AAY4ALT7_9TELE